MSKFRRTVNWRRLWDVDNNTEVKHAINKNQVSLTSDTIEPRLLVGTNGIGNILPTPQSQDGYPVQCLPRQDTLVVDYSAVGSKRGSGLLVSLESFNNLGDSSDSQLRRKPEVLSDAVVNDSLKIDLASTLFNESHLSNGVTGFVEPLHSLKQGSVLRFAWKEFDLDSQLHTTSLLMGGINVKQ